MADNPNLDDTKKQLEIDKLRMEIRYIRRSFLAQLFNTVCLAFIGLSVLYFFQVPQLESNERIQVGNAVLAAQSMANETSRQIVLDQLVRQWPQYEFVAFVATANRRESEARKAEAASAECATLAKQIADLQQSANTLSAQYSREASGGNVSGGGISSVIARATAAVGPAAQSLKAQLEKAQATLAQTRKLHAEKRCTV